MGRMGLLIVRISLFVFCCLAGIYLGSEFISSSYASLWGGISGGLIAVAIICLEVVIKRASGKGIVAALIGLVIAFFLTYLTTTISIPAAWRQSNLYPLIYILTGYLGIMIGVWKGKEFNPANWKILSKMGPRGEIPKILDTSVIIDGRIADIC